MKLSPEAQRLKEENAAILAERLKDPHERAARESSREENLKPGDRDYRPTNDLQANLHKRALTKKGLR